MTYNEINYLNRDNFVLHLRPKPGLLTKFLKKVFYQTVNL